MVLIKELSYKAETSSGIMLVQTTESKPLIIGMIVSIAPDCRFGMGDNGNKIEAASIKAGDIVTYAVYNGDELDVLGNKLFRIRDIDVHGKIPDSALAEVIVDKTDHMWTIRKEMTWDKDNPNNIGQKSSYHVDHKSNK
jgi:co-chaperonin GroES (HSP10)